MNKIDVFNKVKEILVSDFELEADEIKPESLLVTELGLDSIDAVDLIVKLKPYTSGKIESEQFKQVKTVQDVVEIIFPLIAAPKSDEISAH